MRKSKVVTAESVILLLIIWAAAVAILKWLDNSTPIVFLAGVVTALVLFAWAAPERFRAAADWCYQYRWCLALAVFCACVVLRLHGSSIGVYNQVFKEKIESSITTLFGIPRWVRSDEFGVQTPVFFSQSYNDYQLYSQQMSLSPTNMVLDYYSPVRDLTAIGKPMMWGYLLFGNEVGLSWYWCGEIILLFMTALEMGIILTGGRRFESILCAVLITLSPEIQWWVLPHMPIVILYAMGLYCVGYYFFTVESPLRKCFFAFLAVVTVTGFALSIFPSFQVPCAHTVVILLTATLYRERDRITFSRHEWIRIAVPVAAVAAIIGRFLAVSLDDIHLLLNTVYPGHRVSTGGTWPIKALFTDISSLFLPYKDITFANNCEVSTYIQTAPFFLVLFPRIFFFMKKKKDRNIIVGGALFVTLLLQICYMVVGISEFLAEVTMLRFCNRMDSIYDWTATIYTVWGISVLMKYPNLLRKGEKILYPLVYGTCCWLLVDDTLKDYFAKFFVHGTINIGVPLIIASLLAFVLVLMLATYGRKRLLVGLVCSIMFFAGGTVNPLERGIGAITNHPISETISEIAEKEPDELWLCTDCAFYFSNYVMANGARTLTATNFYPDLDKWAIIDPERKFDELFNRYANMTAKLGEGDNRVDLPRPDLIEIELRPETLKELNVHYLFSRTDYGNLLMTAGIDWEYINGQNGYKIYRLNYASA